MSLESGSKLGPYEILAPLGAGGMGEVFRATDIRLHRTVAIKVLPPDKVADADRKRRFIQEARAASALNHPNIVTLYDIASDNGIDYLVMEYVAGEPIGKRVTPNGLPTAELVGYAVQIASALAAAHAAGIVHRDIKPANVLVTGPESSAGPGQVKVLDFGIAKLTEPEPHPGGETRTMEPLLTQAGAIIGTLAYMSPEQARGENVDARADLFSFGALLYEIACGKRPFPKPLDWSAPAADVLPRELRGIVLKLLASDREQRYQTAAEVIADLQRLQPSPHRQPGSGRWWIAAAMAALAVAAASVILLRPKHPASRDQWVKMTNFPDSVSQPALSPDGRMLTFVRGPETFSGPGQIYLKQLPDGEPVQLTRDNLTKMSPVFSPDGSRIAYTVGGWNTWVVPVVSAQPRPWLQNASGLLWFGTERLIFSAYKNGIMGVVTAEENRAGERDVYRPATARGMAHRSYPSPDGKSVLLVEMERALWLPCRLVALDGASPSHPVGPPGAKCTFAAWSPDGKWMYFSSSAGESFHIWRQRYPDGPPEPVTSGPAEEEGIAMAADGRSFITAVAQRQSVVWIHDSTGERSISLEGYSYDPKFTPDGKRLCYRILKGGLTTFDDSELRVVDLDSGHNEPLLPGLAVYGSTGRAYEISPDGRQVAAAVRDRDGKHHVWLAALDRQSPPRQTVEGDSPLFGTHGEIFFRTVEGPATAHLNEIHPDGTGRRRLSEQVINLPAGISPDGQWIITRATVNGLEAVIALPASGASAARAIFARGSSYHLAWSPDGRLLFVSVPTAATATHLVGRTYVVPLLPGQVFPEMPAGGYQSVADLARRPDVKVIDAFDAAPGPSAETYAFSRATVQRNLYRIPIP